MQIGKSANLPISWWPGKFPVEDCPPANSLPGRTRARGNVAGINFPSTQYLHPNMKVIYWRLHIKTPFTPWDIRTWAMWKVCLQTFRNNGICYFLTNIQTLRANNSRTLKIIVVEYWLLFSYQHKHIGRLSNLYFCTFKTYDLRRLGKIRKISKLATIINLFPVFLFHMKIRVCLKYFLNHCLCKHIIATNSPQTRSNLICFPFTLFQSKIGATKM